jgi:hypothetical protein
MIPSSEFYRHSGKFGTTGAAVSLLIGVVTAYLLGWVYVYVAAGIGDAAFIATFVSAVIIGGIVGAALTIAKARNLKLAAVLGAVTGLIAVYFDWAIWAHMMLADAGKQVSSWFFIAKPWLLWELIVDLNQNGVWSYRGFHPHGPALWGVWGAEAAIIVGTCTWAAYSMNSEDPFCEMCNEWTKVEKDVIWTAMLDQHAMDNVFEFKNWDELAKHPVPDDGPQLQIDLHVCPKCKSFQTLLARRVEWKKTQGKREKKEKTLIQHLIISPSDADHIRTAAAALEDADEPGDDSEGKSDAAKSGR